MNPLQEAIEHFLETSTKPVLYEPGEEPFAITPESFYLQAHNEKLFVQAWDENRNIVRRVIGMESNVRGKLCLEIERFGKRRGTLSLVDLDRPKNYGLPRQSARQALRETFRCFLKRQFSGYTIASLSTETNLEQTLSPIYPRALLRHGSSAWAAIAAPSDPLHVDGVLSFGLIWLDYLRRRQTDLIVRGLILYLPAGLEKTTCLRLRFLNTQVARYSAFVYSEDGLDYPVDLGDYGNLDTHLEPCRRRLPSAIDLAAERLKGITGVDAIERSDGEISLRVRGLEFARTLGSRLLVGIDQRTPASADEAERFALELAAARQPDPCDRMNPLYLRARELWLESCVRAELPEIDATLLPDRVYGQVPAFAASDRGVIDLLGVDVSGRLAVIELKASEDLHLPLQALDYWMRVKWHLDRGEFSPNGYFPGIELRREAPRLLLVSPALQVHPANERVLSYLSPSIEVEHIGVGIEWQKKLKVMFRL